MVPQIMMRQQSSLRMKKMLRWLYSELCHALLTARTDARAAKIGASAAATSESANISPSARAVSLVNHVPYTGTTPAGAVGRCRLACLCYHRYMRRFAATRLIANKPVLSLFISL